MRDFTLPFGALGMVALTLALSGCGRQKPKAGASEQGPKAAAAPAKRDEAKFALGREVFRRKAQPACKACHTLQEAGASGAVGPNLDSLSKSEAEIAAAVRGGVGVMPAQGEILSAAEIEAVAYYVVNARKAR